MAAAEGSASASQGSASASQASSSGSESESEMSDYQQPHPSSHLLMSRRLSQQRRQHAAIDYNQLSLEEEEEEDDDDDEEEEESEVDVEYVHPSCYSRPRAPAPHLGGKKRSRGQGGGVEEGRKVEQRRNISSLFQPQSPLVSENLKVGVVILLCVCV